MTTTRRRTPLRAEDTPGDAPPDSTAETTAAVAVDDREPAHAQASDGAGGPPPEPPSPDAVVDKLGIVHVEPHEHTASDRAAFVDAVRNLRISGGTLNLSERTLMVLGGIVAPLGLLFVLLGWFGAARTPNSFEQIPYLISGGLFGLGLVFLGSFFYFAHWITELVKEQRAGSAALLEALGSLRESIESQPAVVAVGGASGGSVGDNGTLELVATARGVMAHRPDCVVVAGKAGVRAVDADDGLAPCKLCDPYTDPVPAD